MAPTTIYQLVWQTRRLFQHLRAVSESLLEGTGINTSQRAVLEVLNNKQSMSVPQIAQQLTVSRQHIQIIVNELQALDLLAAIDNPAHKRSPLMATTKAGAKLFESIQKSEAEILETIQKGFSKQDLLTTTKTLESFNAKLASSDRG